MNFNALPLRQSFALDYNTSTLFIMPIDYILSRLYKSDLKHRRLSKQQILNFTKQYSS